MRARDHSPLAHTDKMAGERGAAEGAPAGERGDTFLLTLEHGEHLDSALYRFEKGCYLEFCPGPSLLGRKVFLYTNYVVGDDQDEKGERAEFVRSQYYALEWRECDDEGGAARALGAGALVSAADLRCRLPLRRAGSFHYYFVYDDAESPVGPQGSGWFGVAPTLLVGAGGRERVPLDGVACQTVVAKCLGPLARWEAVLRVAKEAGYNMVHFTPVQRRGASDSGYSLADRLTLDPRFGDGGFADVESLVTKMRTEWKMLSICDVVLNHTADDTPWLEAHPEASYNCANCPHLRPAALLDALLARLSAAAARGELAAHGVPERLERHEQLEALERLLTTQLVPEARLGELFMCDAAALAAEWTRLARGRVPAPHAAADELRLLPDAGRRRLRARVDLEAALRVYNVHRADCADEEERLRRCADALRRRLDALNAAAADAARDHLRAAVRNVVAGARYERLQADGPRHAAVCDRHPLAPRYFTWSSDVSGMSLAEIEAVVYGADGARVRAHNGWLLHGDPLADFAAPDRDGRVFLRRELIAWGDSVKLRYGAGPEDSPFLWAHMREYVRRTAEVFAGLRLDNCHSTPLHVAEHMLDAARAVNPELYAVAELFTDSADVDNIFVNRLGLTALVREAQAAGDARELGRLLHRYGGRAVGSLAAAAGGARVAAPAVAPALLMDLTHDNPGCVARRSAHDLPASAALVAAAGCGAGSTRGYDELVPHAVDVVTEARRYAAWGEGAGQVDARCGMLAARRALNELHAALAADGYCEQFVDQLDEHVVAVTRHHPLSRKSVIVVAFTAFTAPGADGGARAVPPLRVDGALEDVLLHITTDVDGAAPAFARRDDYINGLAGVRVTVRRAPPPAEWPCAARDDGALTVLEWPGAAPGAVLAVRVAPRAAAAAALRRLAAPPPLAPALLALDLADLNALLYRCDAEEREAGGGGVYEVPGWGALPYAGLQGAASLLADAVAADDLAHPLCANLRAGDWLAEYTCARAEREPRLRAAAAVLRAALQPLAALPRYLVPCEFARALLALHGAAARAALARLRGPAVRGGLARALALTSVQLLGAVRSAPLPAPSAALPPPPPPRTSLSAGLPHFATGHMRCWGRDTFVALPGLLLLTGRYEESRAHILGFAACLRHGLIPNLLDGGERARFNCRDAVWWWLHAVRRHVELAPGGAALLAEPVARLFPRDDAEPGAGAGGGADQPLHDVMQEALDAHFQGRVFRERRAGRELDAHMADRGFTVQIGIDPDTGFPFGGNDANCGTWMDKMGSSERAGTRGRPATPRDGSAVELVALAHSVAAFLGAMHRAGRHPHPGLARRHADGALTAWTWPQWAERIRRNFERHFWVPAEPAAHEPRPDLVHRRAIYKDSHGASQPWADYQLRCNFSVAMAIAPELFEPKHAALALDAVERLLAGPLGLKTLDPADWAYRPVYDPADDSADPSVAHGFNYHQGPEWTWPLPFYLRARLAFAREPRAVAAVYAALGPLLREIRTSPWRGLPELTDAGGAPSAHACRSQAWSSGAALELLHELQLRRPPPAD